MSDLSGAGGRNRSLNQNQTLEELLGITKKDDKNSLTSQHRPPTRHGRDSVSSTEENKDPSPIGSSSGIESWRIEDDLRKTQPTNLENSDDDFLAKLNQMRRRSLLMSQEANEVKIIEPPPERKVREIARKPSEIREESEDDANNNSKGRDAFKREKMMSTLSRPSTGSSTKTFRIEEEKREEKPIPKKRSTSAGKTQKSQVPSFSQSKPPTGSSAHEQWLRRKMEEEKEKKRKKKEEEEEKKRIEDDKKKTAAKLFERWKADLDERLRKEKREQREKEKEKKLREEEKKTTKRKDAEKTFNAWKLERSKSLSASQKSLKRREEEEQRKKEEEQKAKESEANKAFQAWVAKKKEAEEKKKRELEEKEMTEQERKEAEKEYKEMLAQEAYETWLEIKEGERELSERVGSAMSRESLRQLPWVPPSNTIPRQFVSSGKNRRRSLDRRVRATSAQIPRVPRATSVKSIYSMK